MNVVAVLFVCLACALAPSNGLLDAAGIAMAAEKDGAPAAQGESGGPAKDTPAQSETPKNGEDPPSEDEPAGSDPDTSEEIFVPSEDISEDIDVPFPVDI